MRIDSQRTPESTPTAQVGAPETSQASTAGQAPSTTDTAQISGDVAFAGQAMAAAQAASDVRPEAVARAQALLDSGQLGQNLDRLANKMIDSLLP